MMAEDKTILRMHAEVCKSFAHPTRLAILNALRDREMTVTDMTEALSVAKGNLAQHLTILKQRQIVDTRREGINVYYHVTDPKIIQACELMRSVLLNQLKAAEKLSRKVSTG
jgi:ArsR family transcriptional regulator